MSVVVFNMAKLIRFGSEIEMEDGSTISAAADELGVVFGCRHGRCGTCTIKVIDGYDNLEEKNGAEKLLDLPEGCRLACQAKIKAGEVLIE